MEKETTIDFESLFESFFIYTNSENKEDSLNSLSISHLESKVGEVGDPEKDPEFINKIKTALDLSENKAEKILVISAAYDLCEYVMSGSSKVNKDEVFGFLREYSDCAKFILFVNREACRLKNANDEMIKSVKDRIKPNAEKLFNELKF